MEGKRLSFKKLASDKRASIFEELYAAVVDGDKDKFIELAGDLGLPPPVAEKLWDCWQGILSEGVPGWPS